MSAGVTPVLAAAAGPAPTSATCATCAACCCRLEVILMGEDAVPEEYVVTDKWGGWVMERLDDGWCAALDRDTMLCTIYDVRPGVCRDYVMGESECLGERVRQGIDARRN